MHALVEIGLGNAVVSALLALPAAAVSRIGRWPALAHGLWLLVFVKLLTPVAFPVPVTWPAVGSAAESSDVPAVTNFAPEIAGGAAAVADFQPLPRPAPAVEANVEPEPAPAPPPAWGLSWEQSLVLVWLTGSLLWFGWTGLNVCRFHRLLRHAWPAPADLQNRVDELAERLGLPSAPKIWLVPGALSPLVWALGRSPRLVFPARLLERLDDGQRDAILVHELAHVRRRDHWVRRLELLTAGLYWWHPVVWWARRELREAEELCCDAWVGWALAGDGRAYALALLQTVAFVSQARLPLPAAASGAGHVSHLRRRLLMILGQTTPRSLSWAGRLVVISLGLCLLPFLPVEAQTPPPRGADRQRQIEVLKEALRVLEEQPDQAGGSTKLKDPKNEEEVKKLRADAEKLAKQIQERGKQLHDLQAKHREVLTKLHELGAADSWAFSYVGQAPYAGLRYTVTTPAPVAAADPPVSLYTATPATASYVLTKPAPVATSLLATPAPVATPPAVAVWETTPAPAVKARPADWEQRLDRLTSELQELRRELQREKVRTRSPTPAVK